MTATLDTSTRPRAQAKPMGKAARLAKARAKTLAFDTLPPDPDRRAKVWCKPVSYTGSRPPLVWLLGTHGGAGVSSLAQQIAPAADCQREWPAVLGDESPFVVLVARETIEGLTRAHDLLRQYHCGQAGPGRVILIGLITVAYQPGTMPAAIRRYRNVVADLVPAEALWRVTWQRGWPVSPLSDLPVWVPGDERPAKGRDPLVGVRALGEQLLAAITAVLSGPNPANPSGAHS